MLKLYSDKHFCTNLLAVMVHFHSTAMVPDMQSGDSQFNNSVASCIHFQNAYD